MACPGAFRALLLAWGCLAAPAGLAHAQGAPAPPAAPPLSPPLSPMLSPMLSTDLSPQLPSAVAVPLPDGRLGQLLCGPAGLPFASGGCTYGDYTGALTLFHPSGAVSEVLPLRRGQLHGIYERYDERGHLLARQAFRDGVPLQISQLQPGAPLTFGDGAPQEIPGQSLPPPPMVPDVTPPPAPETPAETPPPPPPPSPWRAGLGLNIPVGMAEQTFMTGVRGDVLVPLSTRLALELGVAYQRGFREAPPDTGWDNVPFGLNLRWSSAPELAGIFLLGGLGGAWSHRVVPGFIPTQTSETGWFVTGEVGVGMAFPVGRREASSAGSSRFRLSFDGRFGFRARVDSAPRLQYTDSDGKLQDALGSGWTFIFHTGVLWLR